MVPPNIAPTLDYHVKTIVVSPFHISLEMNIAALVLLIG